MRTTRRELLGIGGACLAGFILPARAIAAGGVVDIAMRGGAHGAHVWFDPVGVRVEPGQTLRWRNLDAGNAHTATAYHPRNYDHPLRIPSGVAAWDSDYLLPDESFTVTLTQEGVYDYFCIPHEAAGMVGRIVVGRPLNRDKLAAAEGLPEGVLSAFPSVDEIMSKGIVRST